MFSTLKKIVVMATIGVAVLFVWSAPSSAMTKAEYKKPIYGKELKKYIVKYSKKVKLDPAATLAVACTEGGFKGAVGDGGSSFGPWQLHRGGALPSKVKNPRRWANSPQGIGYALRAQSKIARGKHGFNAISLIVRLFERPLYPSSQIGKAQGYYKAMQRFAKKC